MSVPCSSTLYTYVYLSVDIIMFSGGAFTESHKVRTSRYVTGVSCTTENLESLKDFLGVFVDWRNEKKVHLIFCFCRIDLHAAV